MKKNINMKKIISLIVACSIVISMSACGNSNSSNSDGAESTTSTPTEATDTNSDSTDNATDSNESATAEKPTKITFMGTTILTDENGHDEFIAEYKSRTGIDLEIIKPDHNQYYENVNLSFTSGSIPDVIELGSTYYPTYAVNGALWDMTDAWNNSELKASGNVDEKYVDALKIDDKLFGFPMTKGNGTITYLRGDWMEKLNLEVPTNYEEFLTVLRAFRDNDPDGNGVDDTIPISAAGLIGDETPYDIYLREFYQDARPDIIEVDGKFVDGMLEPNMKDALKRMQDAYAENLIDKEVITNKTSTVRDKFFDSKVGVFNYWAGTWNFNLQKNLQAANPEGTVVPMPPIAETKYIERVPTALAITNQAVNPEGIFEYFISYSHDSGEGQMLFTRGVENFHYEEKDGKIVQMPQTESPDKPFEKSFYSPELSFTNFEDPIELDPLVTSSLEMFEANSDINSLPLISETISNNLPEIQTLRKQYIANIVTGDLSVDEGLEKYESDSKYLMDEILAELNN